MARVLSPFLAAVGAAWEEGPASGEWIADRLDEFGPTVGHAVPLGYPAYAIVTIPWPDDDDEEDTMGPAIVLDALLDVLEPFTGEQVVHSGIWDGFGWMYSAGQDPRTAPGMSAHVGWSAGSAQPTQDQIDQALGEARERMAAGRVELPDVEPLRLPERQYYLWSGPLRSALAFRHQAYSPPSLIWPEDRCWFLGAPIYTHEFALAGPAALIERVLHDTRLQARATTTDDDLDIHD